MLNNVFFHLSNNGGLPPDARDWVVRLPGNSGSDPYIPRALFCSVVHFENLHAVSSSSFDGAVLAFSKQMYCTLPLNLFEAWIRRQTPKNTIKYMKPPPHSWHCSIPTTSCCHQMASILWCLVSFMSITGTIISTSASLTVSSLDFFFCCFNNSCIFNPHFMALVYIIVMSFRLSCLMLMQKQIKSWILCTRSGVKVLFGCVAKLALMLYVCINQTVTALRLGLLKTVDFFF